MSELKVRKIGDLCFDFKMGKDVGIDFYLKSEADKVIAEKDTKINQLEALIQNYNRISREIIDNANHQKYKRCLAMAKWCECKRIDAADDRIPRKKWDFYGKWHKCWLIIAEKFKEEAK